MAPVPLQRRGHWFDPSSAHDDITHIWRPIACKYWVVRPLAGSKRERKLRADPPRRSIVFVSVAALESFDKQVSRLSDRQVRARVKREDLSALDKHRQGCERKIDLGRLGLLGDRRSVATLRRSNEGQLPVSGPQSPILGVKEWVVWVAWPVKGGTHLLCPLLMGEAVLPGHWARDRDQ